MRRMNARAVTFLSRTRPELEKRLLLGVLLLVLSVAAVYLFTTFSHVPVNRDAGYYIPLARAVLDGESPTVDIDTAYTPFVYYFFAAWLSVVPETTSSLILAVYLVNALNVVLFFVALLPYVQSVGVRLLLALSYWFTIFVCQGQSIFLEPFQVFFLLLALLAYQRTPERYMGVALAGLGVGASVMCKQYSVFPAAGLALMFASERWGRISLRRFVGEALLFTIVATLPFIVWVALTPAEMIKSLYEFGFLGNRASSYAFSEVRGISQGVWPVLADIVEKVVLVNWLFVPAGLWLLLRSPSSEHHAPPSPLPVWALSCVPLLSRQWGHYLQLVAPWGFLLLGSVLAKIQRPIRENCPTFVPLVAASVLMLAVAAPFFLLLAPPLKASNLHGVLVLGGSATLIGAAFFVVGIQKSCGRLAAPQMVLLIVLVLGFQSVFGALMLPFLEMREAKRYQAEEARLLSETFAPGSVVYVIDYPELYVTGQLVSPGGNYAFTRSAGRQYVPLDKAADWAAVDRVAMRPGTPDAEEFLERAGFSRIATDPALQLLLFEKAPTSHQ